MQNLKEQYSKLTAYLKSRTRRETYQSKVELSVPLPNGWKPLISKGSSVGGSPVKAIDEEVGLFSVNIQRGAAIGMWCDDPSIPFIRGSSYSGLEGPTSYVLIPDCYRGERRMTDKYSVLYNNLVKRYGGKTASMIDNFLLKITTLDLENHFYPVIPNGTLLLRIFSEPDVSYYVPEILLQAYYDEVMSK